jgi:hypothetical protein
MMKKVILITLCSGLLLAGCGHNVPQYQTESTSQIVSPDSAKPKSEPIKKVEPLKYTITEYNLIKYGDNWKYVLVDEKYTHAELEEIARELHNKYPTTCFNLFANIKTLKLMYRYDSTNSYVTKQIQYPEEALKRDDRGIVNQMFVSNTQGRVWSYTSPNYETIELE